MPESGPITTLPARIGFDHAVVCSLDQIADAYRYVVTGQKAGIVVIDVAEGQGGSP